MRRRMRVADSVPKRRVQAESRRSLKVSGTHRRDLLYQQMEREVVLILLLFLLLIVILLYFS
jgi:hypothetical protein